MIHTGKLFIWKNGVLQEETLLFLTVVKMRKKFNRNTFLLAKLALVFTT